MCWNMGADIVNTKNSYQSYLIRGTDWAGIEIYEVYPTILHNDNAAQTLGALGPLGLRWGQNPPIFALDTPNQKNGWKQQVDKLWILETYWIPLASLAYAIPAWLIPRDRRVWTDRVLWSYMIGGWTMRNQIWSATISSDSTSLLSFISTGSWGPNVQRFRDRAERLTSKA